MRKKYIILIIIAIILLCIYYFLFIRKLYSSSYKIIRNKDNINKLMIVAHPDDELIFGGRELICEPGWKVICVTNATLKSNYKLDPYSTNIREDEFISVMNALDCAYEMWDYESFLFNANWDETQFMNDLIRVINERDYKKIVTHNLQGEYGHVQHRKISKMIHSLKLNNLYVFGYDMNQKNPYVNELETFLKLYPSQKNVIKKHANYIIHQLCKKVIFN